MDVKYQETKNFYENWLTNFCKNLRLTSSYYMLISIFFVDSDFITSVNTREALGMMEGAFDVVLMLTSDRSLGPSQLQGIYHPHSRFSTCRWNVSGIDVWVEANKCDQAIFAALKGVDYEGFGRVDLLGPLKSANRRDIQETAVPSIYP